MKERWTSFNLALLLPPLPPAQRQNNNDPRPFCSFHHPQQVCRIFLFFTNEHIRNPEQVVNSLNNNTVYQMVWSRDWMWLVTQRDIRLVSPKVESFFGNPYVLHLHVRNALSTLKMQYLIWSEWGWTHPIPLTTSCRRPADLLSLWVDDFITPS